MTKIVLLNGPPRCGKDKASEMLCHHFNGVPQKISKVLKLKTHAFYGVLGLDGAPVRHDWFEACKDTPQDVFEGLTPREAYIAMSERYIKPVHGDGYLGRVLAREIRRADAMLRAERTHIVSDSGFRGEALELVKEFGAENIRLVRIVREGYDFSGDSRGYIDLSDVGVMCDAVINPGNHLFRQNLLAFLRS